MKTNKGKVKFYTHGQNYLPKNRLILRQWIIDVVKNEKKTFEEISFIFCNDEFVYNLNVNYLKHDTRTDVITFDYTEGKCISGEIYINVDMVRENANTYNCSISDEIHRVMVHGVLHLLGYKDESISDKEKMTKKEDFYLSKLVFNK
ncbi:MAG: rRNA maturation RNase YbeY [Bacteroidales bacterium]|jgi:probable rRNA maturation factor